MSQQLDGLKKGPRARHMTSRYSEPDNRLTRRGEGGGITMGYFRMEQNLVEGSLRCWGEGVRTGPWGRKDSKIKGPKTSRMYSIFSSPPSAESKEAGGGARGGGTPSLNENLYWESWGKILEETGTFPKIIAPEGWRAGPPQRLSVRNTPPRVPPNGPTRRWAPPLLTWRRGNQRGGQLRRGVSRWLVWTMEKGEVR